MARVATSVRGTKDGFQAISLISAELVAATHSFEGRTSHTTNNDEQRAMQFAAGAARSAGKTTPWVMLKSSDKAVPVTLRPLTPYERKQFDIINHTTAIIAASRRAWKLSQHDGRERGFFIYRKDNAGFYPGETVIGTTNSMVGLSQTYKRLNVFKGNLDVAVAYYHTHPGYYPGVSSADNKDRNFGRAYLVFIIIQHYKGFTIGDYQ